MILFDDTIDTSGIDANEPHIGTQTSHAITRLRASNDPPTLFISGGVPVRLQLLDDSASFKLEALNVDIMRYELDNRISWYAKNLSKNGDSDLRYRVTPKIDVVRNVLASPLLYDLPRLERIVRIPVYNSEGVLTMPGYDTSTHLYYLPTPGLTVPCPDSNPEQPWVDWARDLLLYEWLGDFPFATVSERANALALVITPFVRDMIKGATPLHLIEKNRPGTGATLLADITTTLMLGKPSPSGPAPNDDSEWRKRIATKLIKSDPFFYIDNLGPGALDFPSVKQVLTAGVFEDRLLGSNQLIEQEVKCVWLATANNLSLPLELLRRVVRIRMLAKDDHPELRTDLKYPLLRDWTCDNRSSLLQAVYTLVNHWIALGRPNPSVAPNIGGFEHYARVIGGILESADVGGFLCNRQDSYDMADPFEMSILTFLEKLYATFNSEYLTINDMLPFTVDLGFRGTDHAKRIALGRFLHERRETPTGNYKISEPKYRHGSPTYRIFKLDPEPEPES